MPKRKAMCCCTMYNGMYTVSRAYVSVLCAGSQSGEVQEDIGQRICTACQVQY